MRAWSMIFFPRTGSITKNIRNQIFSDKKKQQAILKIHNPKMKKHYFVAIILKSTLFKRGGVGFQSHFFFYLISR